MNKRRRPSRRRRPATPWKSEAELCAAFTELATAEGWTVYPECSGWDMLVVRDGVQIGIEAKLRPNLEVLGQALGHCGGPEYPRSKGPDFFAVLVPWMDNNFERISHLCGVTPIKLWESSRHGWQIVPDLPPTNGDAWEKWLESLWHPNAFSEPCWAPPYVPELPAGAPAPIRLTRWKVDAVRLCVRLREQGFLYRKDITEAGLSPTYFTQHLLDAAGKDGKLVRYVARPGVRLPDEDHPDIAEKIRQEGPIAKRADHQLPLTETSS